MFLATLEGISEQTTAADFPIAPRSPVFLSQRWQVLGDNMNVASMLLIYMCMFTYRPI